MRVEEVIERKRNRAIAYMHKAASQAVLQPSKDGEVLDSDVVDVPPNVDVVGPQARVIVAEDALPLAEVIAGLYNLNMLTDKFRA